MIIFSSSDITALYKKDILKVLSLPKGFCIHFRYELSDISTEVVQMLPNVIGREGLIIYTKDNDPEKIPDERTVSFFPVRRVTVTHYREHAETRLQHFNLELGDFVACDFGFKTPNTNPPFNAVMLGDILRSERRSWVEKVEQLVAFDVSFNNHLFFNMALYSAGSLDDYHIDSPFDKQEEVSYFQLSEAKAYILDLSIYISDNRITEIEKYECKLEYEKKDFLISNPGTIVIGSEKDNRRYKLITKAIDNRRSFDYVKIIASKKGTTPDEFYEMVIRFNVSKSIGKAILFTLLFIMNLFGTALLAYVFTKGLGFLWGLTAVLLVIASAVLQYLFYNKSK